MIGSKQFLEHQLVCVRRLINIKSFPAEGNLEVIKWISGEFFTKEMKDYRFSILHES